MTEVATERLYSWMQKISLDYADPFLLESIAQRLNIATVTTKDIASELYVIYAAILDTILQGQYSAFPYPGDERMRIPYLPRASRR